MKELIILIGNIGSGKTTVTKKLAKEGYVVVSRDAFRYMLGGGNYIFKPELEPIVHGMNIDCLIRCLQAGLDVVIDETNVSRSMRKRYTELGKDYGYKIITIEMPRLSMRTCVSRRMKDPHGQPDRKLWEGVWKKFDERYQYPTYTEGFDNILKLSKRSKNLTFTVPFKEN